MSPWSALVTILMGVNLVRLIRYERIVAIVATIVTIGFGLLGGREYHDWWRLLLVGFSMGLAIWVWGPLCLSTSSRKLMLGLGCFVVGCGGLFFLLPVDVPSQSKGWPWLAAFLILADPVTRLLRLNLGLLGKTPLSVPDAYGRGEAIGVLERWITLVMIIRGDYAAMAFIVAAKALARHKRLDDEEFAEYFLVGTLASMFMAIIVAEGLRALLTTLS